jgi:hypothetical protein
MDMLFLVAPTVLQIYRIGRRLSVGDKKAQYNVMG